MKNKARVSLLAILLCMSALFIPITAFAASGDTTPPTLTVDYDDGRLAITATDDDSGVEAVYIDGHRVNSLANGNATITLKDYAGNNQMVSVYAVDFAGNRSNTVQFENPYYTAPVSSRPASTTTSTATSSPASSSTTSQPQASSTSVVSSAVSGASSETTSSESSGETAIPDGSKAFTPDGTGTVVDNATDADGKEFYTITTANGNVFYLVVDKERASENVYFLNAVTESDLMALAEQDGVTVIPGESAIPGDGITDTDILPEDTGEDEALEDEDEQADTTGSNSGVILFIVIVAAAVGGVGYYIKVVKPRQQSDLDYDDEDEEVYGDEDGEDIDLAEEDDASEYSVYQPPQSEPEAPEYEADFEPEGEE